MDLKLYKTTDDKRVVNKTLTDVKNSITGSNDNTVSGVILKEDTSIIAPTFIFSGLSIDELPAFNYIYFPKMARYYFVNDVRISTGKRIEVDCSEDVLYTYRKDIKELSPIIARQEALKNDDLPDDLLPLYAEQDATSKILGTIPKAYSVILTTSGSTSSTSSN